MVSSVRRRLGGIATGATVLPLGAAAALAVVPVLGWALAAGGGQFGGTVGRGGFGFGLCPLAGLGQCATSYCQCASFACAVRQARTSLSTVATMRCASARPFAVIAALMRVRS